MLNEPAAEDGTQTGCDSGKAGPHADRPSALLAVKRSADQGQTSRHEKRSTNALKRACRYKLAYVDRETASQRGDGKDNDAGKKHFATAQQVSQRSSDQDEGTQHKGI